MLSISTFVTSIADDQPELMDLGEPDDTVVLLPAGLYNTYQYCHYYRPSLMPS